MGSRGAAGHGKLRGHHARAPGPHDLPSALLLHHLQGGYKAFCAAAPELCTPAGAYLPEKDPAFAAQRAAARATAAREWKALDRAARAEGSNCTAGGKRKRRADGMAAGADAAAVTESAAATEHAEEAAAAAGTEPGCWEVREGDSLWYVSNAVASAAAAGGGEWDEDELQAALAASLAGLQQGAPAKRARAEPHQVMPEVPSRAGEKAAQRPAALADPLVS